MKKKFLSIVMTLVLIISCTASAQAEIIHYKKYKNFRYNKFDYKSINIRYYTGKKTKVTVPEKIKGIKVRYVDLIRAKNLKSIKLSRYVKSAGLSRNKLLKKVSVSKQNKYLSVKNNMVLNKKKTKLISVLGGYDEIRIPESVKIVGNGSFYHSKARKVTITKNVKKIDYCFSYCNKLSEVIFEGNSIPKIAEVAFGSHTNEINFHVNSKELAEELLKKLEGKQHFYARIYVGNELVLEKQLTRDDM